MQHRLGVAKRLLQASTRCPIRAFSSIVGSSSVTHAEAPETEKARLMSGKKFTKVDEGVAYKRYLTVFDRTIRVDCEHTGEVHTVKYDVVGHPQCAFKSVQIMPFHTAVNGGEPEVTMILEYCQGPDALCWNLPSGGFNPQTHKSLVECAQAELSEEALLHGGELIQLTAPDHPGFYEVKWCANRYTPFLVINPEQDPSPGERDIEEHIQVVRVPVSRFIALMDAGELMMPSMMTGKLGLEYLRAKGLLE